MEESLLHAFDRILFTFYFAETFNFLPAVLRFILSHQSFFGLVDIESNETLVLIAKINLYHRAVVKISRLYCDRAF